MIYHRKYDSYDRYVFVQGNKARCVNARSRLINSIPKKVNSFVRQFSHFTKYLLPGKILCLGARTGAEVQAARKLGFPDSIGVDLHPLGKYVMQGDWHSLPFADASFENVYCNSLDHCADFESLVREVTRILVPNGRFVYLSDVCYALDSRLPGDEIDIDAVINNRVGTNVHNAMWWDSLKDIADRFCEAGFVIEHYFALKKRGGQSGYVLRKL